MLLLENVEKTFNRGTINEKKALNGLNLSMKDGDFVTVIGGNGAGSKRGETSGSECAGTCGV